MLLTILSISVFTVETLGGKIVAQGNPIDVFSQEMSFHCIVWDKENNDERKRSNKTMLSCFNKKLQLAMQFLLCSRCRLLS